MEFMGYKDIANMPTSLTREEVTDRLNTGCQGWHESLLRSYHVAKKVRWLLEQHTSSQVILELMDLMESDELQPYGWHENKYHEESGHHGSLGECSICRPNR